MDKERRRFLVVLGGSVVSVGVGCSGGVGGEVTGGVGAGGDGAGGDGAGGAPGAGSSTGAAGTGASSSTGGKTSSSSSSSSGGGSCQMKPVGTGVGAPSQFTQTGLHILPGQKVLIGRDKGGLYALTSICPHQLCNMDGPSGSKTVGSLILQGGQVVGIQCNCHGSRFSNSGDVTAGPATKPLAAFALALGCDGKLYVDTDTEVPSSTRLPG